LIEVADPVTDSVWDQASRAATAGGAIFRGVFAKGVNRGGMNLVFSYVLTYRWSPTEVTVHLHRTPAGNNWVFLRRR
jgi:hypothetical protein